MDRQQAIITFWAAGFSRSSSSGRRTCCRSSSEVRDWSVGDDGLAPPRVQVLLLVRQRSRGAAAEAAVLAEGRGFRFWLLED
jgi:hypothetical protein